MSGKTYSVYVFRRACLYETVDISSSLSKKDAQSQYQKMCLAYCVADGFTVKVYSETLPADIVDTSGWLVGKPMPTTKPIGPVMPGENFGWM